MYISKCSSLKFKNSSLNTIKKVVNDSSNTEDTGHFFLQKKCSNYLFPFMVPLNLFLFCLEKKIVI